MAKKQILRQVARHMADRTFCILMVFKNLHGEYTYSTEILSNNLHVRAIQNGLTPNLSGFLVRANEELELGLQEDMPNAEGLLYLYLEP
jgi:hypothetical protein